MSSAAVVIGTLMVKMDGYSFLRNNSAIFTSAFPLKQGGGGGRHFLVERIWSYRSKCFLLRVEAFSEGICCPGNQTESHTSCLLSLKMAEKYEGVPIHYNTLQQTTFWNIFRENKTYFV